MAFRMICKSLASKSVASAALPRAASSQLYHPHTGGLRHAAGILSRTAWLKEPTSLLSLRHFNSSAVVRSALTDILQEEIKYEADNYEPPEVCSMLCFPAILCALFSTMCPVSPDNLVSVAIACQKHCCGCRKSVQDLQKIGS